MTHIRMMLKGMLLSKALTCMKFYLYKQKWLFYHSRRRIPFRAGKFYSSARHGKWKFSLTSKLFNLFKELLSENKEFVVCAVESGKRHIHKGV